MCFFAPKHEILLPCRRRNGLVPWWLRGNPSSHDTTRGAFLVILPSIVGRVMHLRSPLGDAHWEHPLRDAHSGPTPWIIPKDILSTFDSTQRTLCLRGEHFVQLREEHDG